MFTGIIEDLGTVASISLAGDSGELTVRTSASDGVVAGDSISINGVCLTATGSADDAGELTFDVMGETLQRSTIGGLSRGDRVNIERALRADGRFGGHIVQGHVDAVGRLLSRTAHENWQVLRFEVPSTISPLIAEKGSIAIEGVSLTVSAVSAADVDPAWIEVSLIPETLERTVLGTLPEHAEANFETDILARHVARLAHFSLSATSAVVAGGE